MAASAVHNEIYQTDLTMSDFRYYRTSSVRLALLVATLTLAVCLPQTTGGTEVRERSRQPDALLQRAGLLALRQKYHRLTWRFPTRRRMGHARRCVDLADRALSEAGRRERAAAALTSTACPRAPTAETVRKVRDMFGRGVYRDSLPVDGAKAGLLALKALGGIRLVVVTARGEDAREGSQQWLDDNFPGGQSLALVYSPRRLRADPHGPVSRSSRAVFDELFFTGALCVCAPS